MSRLSENEKYITKIVELIDCVIEGTLYCLEKLNIGDFQIADKILKEVAKVILIYIQNVNKLEKIIRSKYLKEIGENILDITQEFFEEYRIDKFDKFQLLIEYTLIPLLKELREEIYFFGLIYPSKEKMQKYYENEFDRVNKNHYTERSMKTGVYEYPITIQVLAYNKIEYTKQCIEAILKYADEYEYELILINNGSTDGTKEYFESIDYKNKKLINYKKNIGPMIASNAASRVYQSEFVFGISNDVIITENSLKNLLTCIKSDEKIAMVVPTTNCISNNQAINVSYKSIEEMQEFASEYNLSNKNKWNERERLMPMMGCLRSEIFAKNLFLDRLFQYTEFCDDDWSFRLRSEGYKLILAKDTFVHHYGSVTLAEAQINENTLEKSREIFYSKHNVDAWKNVNAKFYIEEKIDFLKKESLDILCIDPGFGAIPYFIANKFKESNNNNVKIHNFTKEGIFADVLKDNFDDFKIGEKSIDVVSHYKDKKFDYIIFCNALDEYDELEQSLTSMRKLLKINGNLVFYINNAFSAHNIYKLITLNDNIFDNKLNINFLSHMELEKMMLNIGYKDIELKGISNRNKDQETRIINEMKIKLGMNITSEENIHIHDIDIVVFSCRNK